MSLPWTLVYSFVWFAFGLTSAKVVETPMGSLEGASRVSRDGRPYTAWTKIPYAKPPVGQLRFANPVPAGSWDGVLQATSPMPACSQERFAMMKLDGGQEDCLYLSIYKPEVDATNLPVLFYVHGGAFVFGHPGAPEMADYLMDENVILVTITYRLGALGFLTLNDLELPGNFGVKDQAMALRWVHDNIAAFGGDPKAITVFGESAGAASAHYLLLTPLTKDLVSKGALLSGTANKVWSRVPVDYIKQTSENLVKQLNCKKSTVKETVACLRQIDDPNKITEAADLVKPEDRGVSVPFGPTIEPIGPGAFATEDLTDVVSTKPILVSIAAGEHLLSETIIKMQGGGKVKNASRDLDGYAATYISTFFSDETQLKTLATKVSNQYFKHDSKSVPELIHDVAMIFQDLGFVYPALDLLETHKGPKWFSQLVHRGEISLMDTLFKMDTKVANHADHILYLFNQRSRYSIAKAEAEPSDVRISKDMVKCLANFAAFGNPVHKDSPVQWPPYNGSEILRIKTEGTQIADADFVAEQKDIFNFWRNIVDQPAVKKDEL